MLYPGPSPSCECSRPCGPFSCSPAHCRDCDRTTTRSCCPPSRSLTRRSVSRCSSHSGGPAKHHIKQVVRSLCCAAVPREDPSRFRCNLCFNHGWHLRRPESPVQWTRSEVGWCRQRPPCRTFGIRAISGHFGPRDGVSRGPTWSHLHEVSRSHRQRSAARSPSCEGRLSCSETSVHCKVTRRGERCGSLFCTLAYRLGGTPGPNRLLGLLGLLPRSSKAGAEPTPLGGCEKFVIKFPLHASPLRS